jgi:hypothetical protein
MAFRGFLLFFLSVFQVIHLIRLNTGHDRSFPAVFLFNINCQPIISKYFDDDVLS